MRHGLPPQLIELCICCITRHQRETTDFLVREAVSAPMCRETIDAKMNDNVTIIVRLGRGMNQPFIMYKMKECKVNRYIIYCKFPFSPRDGNTVV